MPSSHLILCRPLLLLPPIPIYLWPNYGGGNEDNGDFLQRIPCIYCYTQCPQPCSRPPLTHGSIGDSWRLTGKSGSVSHGVTASLLLGPCAQGSICALQESFPVLCKFCQLYGGVNGDLLQEDLCHIQVCCTQSPCLCGSPLLICTSTGDSQTQFISVSVKSLGPGVHKVCLNPLSVSGGNGV